MKVGLRSSDGSLQDLLIGVVSNPQRIVVCKRSDIAWQICWIVAIKDRIDGDDVVLLLGGFLVEHT